ncbi:hypothetical protein KRH_17220 [Kocuria rhizophila DC2201]|uniref:Uncharacterized protein n=1 Tax=Kocuria rhizophila (strain ATCC 9341 / DSM 348 / NBRC 103217 / DC2201) TaxID=378753 RepID=B2GLJ5_KOCRD|nr:hypothetical protein KRH_17220 [Kocuria rhizophila DC2201]
MSSAPEDDAAAARPCRRHVVTGAVQGGPVDAVRTERRRATRRRRAPVSRRGRHAQTARGGRR